MNLILIIEIIQIFFTLLFAVVIHECAHGWVAYKLGDPTAKMSGRLTLNPFKHIDPFGTIILPILLKIFVGFPFGWAKPVPVNFRNLHHPKKDMIWVALAGPGANILLATILSVFLKLNIPFIPNELIRIAIYINLLLAIFNLTPIPPLDGSRVVMGILPNHMVRYYMRLEPFGILIVLVLVQLDFLNFIIPIANMLATLLGAN